MKFEPGHKYELEYRTHPTEYKKVVYIGISPTCELEAIVEFVDCRSLHRVPFSSLRSLKKKRRYWCVQRVGALKPAGIFTEWENAMRFCDVDPNKGLHQIFEVESVEAI